MNAWVQFVKKEMKEMKEFRYISLGLIFGNYIAVSFFAYLNHVPAFISTWVNTLLMAHMVYLIVYYCFRLFLNHHKVVVRGDFSLPGWKVLAAKYGAGVLSFTISLACTLFLGLLSSLIVSQTSMNLASYFPSAIYLYFHLLFISTFIISWIMFGRTLFEVVKKRSPFYARLSIVGVLLALTWLFKHWQESGLYSFLFNWGTVELSAVMPKGGALEVLPAAYIGNYVYHILISVILLLLSGWLMDKKRA